MRRLQGSYPHPVVGHLDDVDSVFMIDQASVTPTTQDVELKFRIRLDDPDLSALIEAGTAALVFNWTCGSTLSSGALQADKLMSHVDGNTWIAYLDQQAVRNTVTVRVAAVAKVAIPDYHLSRQHADYQGARFQVSPGDILGEAGSFEFHVNKLFDPLQPPVGSCFRFVEDPKIKRGLAVRFDDEEQVTVVMSSECLSDLRALGARPEAQVALVVLPALMETISFIRASEQEAGMDDSQKVWYRAVLGLVSSAGDLEGDSSLTLAQRILDNPVEKALRGQLMVEDEE